MENNQILYTLHTYLSAVRLGWWRWLQSTEGSGDTICCWELVTSCVVKCGACLSVIIDEWGLAVCRRAEVFRGWMDRTGAGAVQELCRRGAGGTWWFTVSRSEAVTMELPLVSLIISGLTRCGWHHFRQQRRQICSEWTSQGCQCLYKDGHQIREQCQILCTKAEQLQQLHTSLKAFINQTPVL